MLDFLRGSNGNLSSKRLLGCGLLIFGLFFSSVLFFFSLNKVAADPQTAKNIIDTLLISGSSLLGIGVLEKGIPR